MRLCSDMRGSRAEYGTASMLKVQFRLAPGKFHHDFLADCLDLLSGHG